MSILPLRTKAGPAVTESNARRRLLAWLPGSWLTSSNRIGRTIGRAGEVEEVLALGVVQHERTRDRFQDRVGDSCDVAALDRRVVFHAHVCEHCHLAAPQALDTPLPRRRNSGLLRRHLRAPRRQKLPNFIPRTHRNSLNAFAVL